MSRTIQSLSFSILTGLVALQLGCSGGGGGASSAPGPMSSSQKDRFETTIQNVAYVSDWSIQKSGSTQPQPVPSSPALSSALTAPSLPPDAVKQSLKGKVEDPRFCKVDVIQPVQPPNPPSPPTTGTTTDHFGMTVSGANCPIYFNFDNLQTVTRSAPDAATFDSVFSLDYLAKGEEARSLDVLQFGFKFSMNGSIQSMNGRIVLSGEGQILSQSQGTIRLQLRGTTDIAGGSANTVATLQIVYPDGFIAELKQISSQSGGGAPVNQYYLNGELITQAEFDRYSKALGLEKSESTSSDSSKKPTPL